MLFLLIGWWSAKGDLTTQIDTRRSAVDKAFSDAKENVGAVPNARWTEGAAKKNEKHKADFNTSATSLYEDQLKARVYPRSIRDELNTLKFNSEAELFTARRDILRRCMPHGNLWGWGDEQRRDSISAANADPLPEPTKARLLVLVNPAAGK